MTSLECFKVRLNPFLQLHLIYYPLSSEFATRLELLNTEMAQVFLYWPWSVFLESTFMSMSINHQITIGFRFLKNTFDHNICTKFRTFFLAK